MTEKQLKEKMIADVMDGFDFGKVHSVMQSIDWEWLIGEDEMAVPGMWRIMGRAKGLLEDVMKNYGDEKYHSVSCGGFAASLDEDGNLSLEFILEEMYVQSDNYNINKGYFE